MRAPRQAGASGQRLAQLLDDEVLRAGVEVGVHRQAHHAAGQVVGDGRVAGGVLGVGRLRVDGAGVVDGGGDAGFLQRLACTASRSGTITVYWACAVAVGAHGHGAGAPAGEPVSSSL